MSQSKKFGFSLIELLVVISIIVLLIGILVPVLARARTTANVMKEGVNERNIHVAATVYGTGNKDWFPGLTSAGYYSYVNASDASFAGKYFTAAANSLGSKTSAASIGLCNNYAQAVMMEDNGTNPAQWISPGESNTKSGGTFTSEVAIPSSTGTGNAVTSINNSFAMLAYGVSTLKPEWKSTQNNQAIVLGTRLIFDTTTAAAASVFNSVWTDSQAGKFRGSVVRGDSSTSNENFDKNDCSEVFSTLRYGAVAGKLTVAPTATVAGVFGVHGDETYANFGTQQATTGTFDRAMIGSDND